MPQYAPDFESLLYSGSIAIAADGTFFLADAFQHVVAKVDQDLKVHWSHFQQDAPGLHYPTALEFHDQTLYVCDSWHHCIRKFDLMGNHLGDIGQHGHEVAQLECPADVKIDQNGHLWVVDTNHQAIKVFDLSGSLKQSHAAPQLVANETLDPTRHFGIFSPLQTPRVPFYPQQIRHSEGRWACRDLEAIVFFTTGTTTPAFIYRSPECVQWHLIGFMDDQLLVWSRSTKELFAIQPERQVRIDLELPASEALLCDAAGQHLLQLTRDGITVTPFQGLKEKNRSKIFVFGDTYLPESATADIVQAQLQINSAYEAIKGLLKGIVAADEVLLKPRMKSFGQQYPLDWFLPDTLFYPAGLVHKAKTDEALHLYFNLLRQTVKQARISEYEALSQLLLEQALDLVELKLALTAEFTKLDLEANKVFQRDWALFLIDTSLFCLEGTLIVVRQSFQVSQETNAVLDEIIPSVPHLERFQFKLLSHLRKKQAAAINDARSQFKSNLSELLLDTLLLQGSLEDLRTPLTEGHTYIARIRLLWLARLQPQKSGLGVLPSVSLGSTKVLYFCFLRGESVPVERFASELPTLEDPHGNDRLAWSVYNYMTMNLGQAKQGMENLKEALPGNHHFTAQLGNWNLEWGHRKVAQQLLSETQKSPHHHLYQAYFHYQAADLKAFLAIYDQHPSLQHGLCEKLFCLAYSHLEKDLARRAFAMDSAHTPALISHRKNLLNALFYAFEGDFNQAEALLESLPYQPFGKHFYLSLLNRRHNRKNQALKHLHLEQLSLDTYASRIQKAMLFVGNDETQFEEALKSLPDYAWIYDQGQRISKQQSGFKQAIRNLRAAEEHPWHTLSEQQRLDYLNTVLFLNLFVFAD